MSPGLTHLSAARVAKCDPAVAVAQGLELEPAVDAGGRANGVTLGAQALGLSLDRIDALAQPQFVVEGAKVWREGGVEALGVDVAEGRPRCSGVSRVEAAARFVEARRGAERAAAPSDARASAASVRARATLARSQSAVLLPWA